MSERNYGDDLRDVIGAAEIAISQALHDGMESGYPAGDWLQHDYDHHLEHADGHVADLVGTNDLDEDQLRTALSHAICRLAMAWARKEK